LPGLQGQMRTKRGAEVASQKDFRIGIVSCGVYIPWNRLRREDIAREWGSEASGEKAVASYDEDSVTMSVEAARNCIRVNGLSKACEALYFCSTTFPYLEKQGSAIVAEVLDLPHTTMTVDVGNTLRAGTQGLILATDAIRAGRISGALVCASDRRLYLPGGPNETICGDGAAAFFLGREDLIATVEAILTTRQEIIFTWRSDRDRYVRSYEERFGLEMGYNRELVRAIDMVLKTTGLAPPDIAKVVMYGFHPRHARGVMTRLGFHTNSQLEDSLLTAVGNTGAAQVPMNLVAALEKVNPGDHILVVGYGDGCDVLVLKATERVKLFQKRCTPISHFLNHKRYVPYIKYLQWREILPTEPPPRVPPEAPSPAALWRDNRSLSLQGVKCDFCGTVQYPRSRVCIECGTKDRMVPYDLADKVGRVVTFSHDYLASSPDKPITVGVVDFEGGGRLMCDITDRDPKEIQVGMAVEMTFRVLRSVGGIYDYWWKAKPLRI